MEALDAILDFCEDELLFSIMIQMREQAICVYVSCTSDSSSGLVLISCLLK